MVARTEGYYVEPFCGETGVTQGEPILLNIFNVVVEAVVRHWEYLVAEGGGDDGRENSSGNEAFHPARQKIRACDDRKRWTEGGHTG